MIIKNAEKYKFNINNYIYNIYNKSDQIELDEINLKTNININTYIIQLGKNIINNINTVSKDFNIIKLDKNLILEKGNNYILIISNYDFEIDLDISSIFIEDYYLSNISNDNYILNNTKYYDLFINKGTYNILALIKDKDSNKYDITVNNNQLDKYLKYDNLFNFINKINIDITQKYLLKIQMESNIDIELYMIGNDKVENITKYNNCNEYNIFCKNHYLVKPIALYNNNIYQAIYFEFKFNKFNKYTIFSIDNKINIYIDNILYINNQKIKDYSVEINDFLKILIVNRDNKSLLYYYDNFNIKSSIIKLLELDSNIKLNLKLYEKSYYDSHINKKIVTIKDLYIYKNNKFNTYNDFNLNIIKNDNISTVVQNKNNIILSIGGSYSLSPLNLINKLNKLEYDFIQFNNINENTIDNNNNKILVNLYTEPTKTEPIKTEPTKTEPIKTTPVNIDDTNDLINNFRNYYILILISLIIIIFIISK